MGTPAFITGDEVDVRSDEAGFKGAWFEATVVRTMPRVRRYTVSYASIVTDARDARPLRETVQWSNVRPRPPKAVGDALPIRVGSVVEAYHNDGWWVGTVTRVDGVRYTVGFVETGEEIDFGSEEVRLHLDWVDGKWIFPQGKGVSEKSEASLCNGSLVEVSSDEEGFQGAWYTGNVIKTIGRTRFLVEYHNIKTDDGKKLLRETVDYLHIRPSPPTTTVAKFKLLQEVDAYYQDGWWVGVISRVPRRGAKYVVYFKQTHEEMLFSHRQLRPHVEWIDGRWVQASEALQI